MSKMVQIRNVPDALHRKLKARTAASAGMAEAQPVDAVRPSGYPLQSLVAQELESQFEVIEEWGYTDRTTKEHHTLDIWRRIHR